MKKYEVAIRSREYFEDLAEDIQELLNAGWDLHGTIVVTANPHNSVVPFRFSQMFLRSEEIDI